MARALVLGSTGMLGSAVVTELSAKGVDVQVASRTQGIIFDANQLGVSRLFADAGLRPGDYVVNCVGLTKSRIDEKSTSSIRSAVRLNVEFPLALSVGAEKAELKVLQVATDCVFSGLEGDYSENNAHDPLDVYGKTKSLGEAPSNSVMHLRCSLIGPEQGRSSLFFEWVRNQPKNAHIQGYANHHWNGLSSRAFGRIVAGILRANSFTPGVQHLVPADVVTKEELVRIELSALGRSDVAVESVSAKSDLDRTLTTRNPGLNCRLFEDAGYEKLPTIKEMVNEMCSNLSK